jgi:hypothetical protein
MKVRVIVTPGYLLSRVPAVVCGSGTISTGVGKASGETWSPHGNGRFALIRTEEADGFTGKTQQFGSIEYQIGHRDVSKA